MSAITEMLALAHAAMCEQVPESVVSVTHTYVEAGVAEPKWQTFDAIRGALTSQQIVALGGSVNAETFSLAADAAAVDYETILAGDRVTVAQGDEAATTYSVLSVARDPLKASITLVVGPKHGGQ